MMNPRQMAIQSGPNGPNGFSWEDMLQDSSPGAYRDMSPQYVRPVPMNIPWNRIKGVSPEQTPMVQDFYRGLPSQVDQVMPQSQQEDLKLQEEMRRIMEQAQQISNPRLQAAMGSPGMMGA